MRFLSPVFEKEMRTMARRKRHFVSRALFLGILIFFIFVFWYQQSPYYRFSRGGFQNLSQLGHDLFVVLATVQFVIVSLLVPALTAPVIASEKERNTLGLIMMTNLSSRNILLDKLLSRLVLVGLLLLSSLPIFLTIIAFGGVTAPQILLTYLVIFSAILFCSGIGLFFSTICTKTHEALIATFITMLTYVMLFVFLADTYYYDELQWLLPLEFDNLEMFDAYIFFAICSTVFLTSHLFCHRLLPRASATRRKSHIKRLFTKLNAFFLSINTSGIIVYKENRPIKNNPMLWKECHKNFFGSTTLLIRSCYCLLMISMILIATGHVLYDFNIIATLFMISSLAIMVIIAIVVSATSFTSEREKKSFEVLMSTPLRSRNIILAKFTGIIRILTPLLFFLLLWSLFTDVCTISISTNYYSTSLLWPFSVFIVSQLPLIIIIGLHASIHRKRVSTAILQTFCIFFAWALIPPLIIFILDEFLSFSIPYSNIYAIHSATPLLGVVCIIENGFSPIVSLLLIPLWLIILFRLISSFDKTVGRQ